MRETALFSWMKAGFFRRGRRGYRGQIIILAVIIIFLFFMVAVALIDVYHVEEARIWGYRAAQQAALAGTAGDYASTKWIIYQPTATTVLMTPTPGGSGCIDPVKIELNVTEAYNAAKDMLVMEMEHVRRFTPADYGYDIQVLPNFDGGTKVNFPPPPAARLGTTGDWSTENPAVGVYLWFNVYTFILPAKVTIHVFAAAEVSQPPVCPSP